MSTVELEQDEITALADVVEIYRDRTGGYWREQGKCATEPDVFFPDRRVGSNEPALAVCRTCPVRMLCLTDAILRGHRDGVQGATSGSYRRNAIPRVKAELRRRAGAPRRLEGTDDLTAVADAVFG